VSVYEGNGLTISSGDIYGSFEGKYKYVGHVEGVDISYTVDFIPSEEDKERIERAVKEYNKE